MKNTLTKTTALSFLVFALATAFLAPQVNFAAANPFMHYPMDPHTTVTILFPKTATLQTENVTLKVSLDLSQWYMTYQGTTTLAGHISSVYYVLDEQAMMYTGKLSTASTSTCSLSLSGLSEGNHSLKVYVRTSGYYSRSYVTDGGNPGFTGGYGQVEDSSNIVNFTIAIPTIISTPVISHLSLENKTYSSNQISLTFNVDTPVSQISYSLDNNSNVTIGGNTTLSMPQGSHSMVVYAKDTNGTIGKSNTIFFTITNPTPIPSNSSTPSLSPALEPTPTSTQAPSPSAPEFQVLTALPLMTMAGIVAVLATKLKRRIT